MSRREDGFLAWRKRVKARRLRQLLREAEAATDQVEFDSSTADRLFVVLVDLGMKPPRPPC